MISKCFYLVIILHISNLLVCWCSAWIEEFNIKHYLQHRDELKNASKLKSFKDAVAEIEECIENKDVSNFTFSCFFFTIVHKVYMLTLITCSQGVHKALNCL